MQETPFGRVVEIGETVHEPRTADARQLVHARNIVTADEQIDGGRTRFERGRGIVEG